MASMIDSFGETFSDRLSFLKIFVFSIPVYYSYYLYSTTKDDFTGFFWMAGLTLFLLFGVLIKTSGNVANERDAILPSLNPFPLAAAAAKGIVAIGPYVIITSLLANYLCSLISIIPWLDITLKSLIWIIAASIMVTSFLMFVTNEKILEAYNLKVLAQSAGDLIVMIVVFVIKLAIINIPVVGFIGYVLLVLFGFGPVFDYFWAFVLAFNIAAIGHYLGQVHYEILNYKKNKD
ncbi:MAG: hypothetical protein WCY19_02545 [Candidatus Gastranaerophilaceae bacterium]